MSTAILVTGTDVSIIFGLVSDCISNFEGTKGIGQSSLHINVASGQWSQETKQRWDVGGNASHLHAGIFIAQLHQFFLDISATKLIVSAWVNIWKVLMRLPIQICFQMEYVSIVDS